MRVHSFEAISEPSSTVMILGSMPGRASLDAGQYYAHPRNHFWRIMGELLGFEPSSVIYSDRVSILRSHHIALWDVLATCTRESSLDSDILEASIVPNDFSAFFRGHPKVRSVFFNGAKAEQVYRRHVPPVLDASADLAYARLPSTSPANAATPYIGKLEAWAAVIRAAPWTRTHRTTNSGTF